jgi:HEAT repeat protein
MGPKGKQIFQNYLNSNDQKVKVMAIYSLQDINENLDFFFEDLTKLSLNPKESYEIRVSAIQALCRVPKFNIQLQEPALKTLTQLLEDKNIKLQSATLGALVNLKELAMPLMPKIVTFFENESPAYENAISAFSSLGKARLNVLLDCLSSPKAKVKTAALRSIRYTVEGLDPQKLFNAIKLNWKGGDTTLEFEALISLQAIMSGYPDKTRAEEFKKICEEGLKSSNSKIVDYCKRLLKSV